MALAYDRFLTGKQAPGALNEEGGNAVRIMTVHASKGLEFPVVAVSECFGIRSNSARMQSVRRDDGTLDLVALPGRFPDCRDSLGSLIEGAEVEKQFKKYLSGSGATGPWLDASLVDDVCATGSAAEAWLSMRDEEDRLALEERARLLYVAMTRAREVCLLAMDAPVGRGKGSALTLKPELDLTPAVLERILPDAGASLTCDRLVFDNAQAGDFELIALRDFSYGGVVYEANAELADAEDPVADAHVPEPMDSFTLVEPANVYMRVVPAERAPRDSYSYSSVSAELHEEAEDHPEPTEAPIEGASGEAAVSGGVEAPRDERAVPSHEGDPTALGSAFHAACQWLLELDRADLPVERVDALCRYWGCTAAQRERFDEAVARWLSSDVRAEALACRAVVPRCRSTPSAWMDLWSASVLMPRVPSTCCAPMPPVPVVLC